ncbi:MAG: DUF3253 domain-containing protein [Verrucomicrobiales bacterium]|nr:DUF3253 domain-containing protein [Verrucomicrobiales bacterium]
MTRQEVTLQETIMTLLEARAPGKTICPSEAARKAFPDEWRDHMETTRQVAIQLVDLGELEICQGGKVIDFQNFSGPIRLRKRN